MKLSRATLEELAREFIERSIEITKRAIEASPFKVNEIDEVVLVGGQTRMPAIEKAVKELFGKEPNKSINPDEVVAAGAALQAGIMQGDVKDILLLDVIPLSLGIETLGGVNTTLIKRNVAIPTSHSQVFSTAADNQTSVQIHVIQGDRPMASDNKSLGQFILDGIPPAPRNMPQIEVTFDVDANGILQVKAKDKASGKEQTIRIEASSSLSDAEIERMRKDAENYSAEDAKKKELAELRNSSDQLVYTAEKSLKDNADKVTPEMKAGIESKIAEVKKVREGEAEALKAATEALSTELSKIGEALYKEQGSAAPQSEEAKTDTPEGTSEESTDTK